MNKSNLRYAVIHSTAYAQDTLAQGITGSPRYLGENHVILSLDLKRMDEFTEHVEGMGLSFEDVFVEGSGKVALLTHGKVKELLTQFTVDNEDLL